jgi:hypothetical protein
MALSKKIALILCLFVISLMASTSVFAADVVWGGNGTTNGSCNTLNLDPSVPQGQQSWLFILSSPDGVGPYLLDATFNTGAYVDIVGVQQGGGAVQFTLYTPENATLLSASATGGTSRSNLVVSHCGANPAPLQVTKTANTSFTRTYNWSIVKSVNPDVLNMFTGDSGTVTYTIDVTQTGFTDSAFAVSGNISIYNSSGFAAAVTGVTDNISGFGGVAVNCGVGFPYNLGAGGTLNCTYGTGLPDGSSRTNTATATTSGIVPGGAGSADVIFGAPTTTVNASINVDDTNGSSWAFNGSGSVSYDVTFDCDSDAGQHNNRATIRETGQYDDASVTVNCYGLEVTKTADPSFTRTWDWDITKTGNQASLTLSLEQTFVVGYTVNVSTASTDSDHVVSGNISVHNPAPVDALLNGVSDLVSGGITGTVDCGVSFPYTLTAGDTLNCSYSADLPDKTDRINTATATLQNTPGGTTDFSGSAAVDFDNAAMTEIDECVSVSDDQAGTLGTVCANESPRTFTYNLTVGPYNVCGTRTFVNVATFTTNDTGSTGNASHTVNVNVPCGTGCTLTQGYWKTHSIVGPAPYDNTWALLPGGLAQNTLFYSSGRTWYQVFWTPPAGNAYYNLAHQYMAARLNVLNGASVPSAVQTAMNSANTLFNSVSGTTLSAAQRRTAISLAATLDAYNNGVTGPGHCSE